MAVTVKLTDEEAVLIQAVLQATAETAYSGYERYHRLGQTVIANKHYNRYIELDQAGLTLAHARAQGLLDERDSFERRRTAG